MKQPLEFHPLGNLRTEDNWVCAAGPCRRPISSHPSLMPVSGVSPALGLGLFPVLLACLNAVGFLAN